VGTYITPDSRGHPPSVDQRPPSYRRSFRCARLPLIMEQLWPRYLHTPSKVNLTTLRIQPQPALSPLDVCALQLLSSGTPMPLSREHGHTCSTPFILRHLHPTHEDYADASERVLRLATITHYQARHPPFLQSQALSREAIVKARRPSSKAPSSYYRGSRPSSKIIWQNHCREPSFRTVTLKPHLHHLSESSSLFSRDPACT
jgi:hypothetical protein